jgi:hypothetical protein
MMGSSARPTAPQTIDVILRDPSTGRPELILLESAPPTDAAERTLELQQRLEAYVTFIDTGQHREHLPDAQPEELAIRVLHRSPPTPELLAIRAVRARGDGRDALLVPVIFESEADMRARVAASRPGGSKPWWKFW